MPKWIGGIFGNTIASNAVGTAIKGVFNFRDQYYMKQEGGWSYATYSVSPSTSSVNEGSSVTFTTTTSNVPDGTTLYWTLNTVSGTINASDFSGGAVSGSFTVTGGTGSVVLTLANDATTEGSESFQLQVRTGSTGGPIVATSSTVTINDTSLSQISATGGTIIDSGGFRIHVFTSPGSFVVSNAPPASNTVEYLVIAGGGGGGGRHAGGGGAGGYRTATGFPITATTYPITVGAGGGGSTNSNSPAPVSSPGNPSVFSSITSAGGGRGMHAVGTAPVPASYLDGGSGGGGAVSDSYPPGAIRGLGNQPPVSPPQGNPGGTAGGGPAYGGGGGGGAGASGANGTPTTAGGGGGGSPISWLPASYGTPGPAPGRYFAGGGGGGCYFGIAGASGGFGGGGNGSTGGADPGDPGTTNTGGGGGGSGGNPDTSTGGSGGSGIVAIRYPFV
jgi:hypothetical protein